MDKIRKIHCHLYKYYGCDVMKNMKDYHDKSYPIQERILYLKTAISDYIEFEYQRYVLKQKHKR